MEHLATVVGFMLVSFLVQGVSHFALNKEHYGAIDFVRKDSNVPMGLAVMIFQGVIFSIALSAWKPDVVTMMDGFSVSYAFGFFLAAYIAVVEPAKYKVPNVGRWIRVEASASAVQFTLFAPILVLAHNWV